MNRGFKLLRKVSFIIFLFVISGCASMSIKESKEEFQSIQKPGTMEAYKSFIKKRPHPSYKNRAERIIYDLYNREIDKCFRNGDLEKLKKLTIECRRDTKKSCQPDLFKAIRYNQTHLVEYIVTRYPHTVNGSRSSHWVTPLYCAVYHKSLEQTKILIKAGAKMDPLDKWGNTALHIAIWLKQPEIAKLLISKGANQEVENQFHLKPSDMENMAEVEQMVAKTIDSFNSESNRSNDAPTKTALDDLKEADSRLVMYALALILSNRKSNSKTEALSIAVKLDIPNYEEQLVKLILNASARSRSMAEAYVNSSSEKLAEAGHQYLVKNAEKRKGSVKSVLKEPRQFGWVLGISGRDGSIDEELVSQKREELKKAPVPPKKQEYMKNCREMGGIPVSCTGKIMQSSKSSPLVMGGSDCVICNPMIDSISDTTSTPQGRFLKGEGGIFAAVKGRVGMYETGKIVKISAQHIEIQEKDGKRKTFTISNSTKLCDASQNPITISEIGVGELVTIASILDEENIAVGIRKGPILIQKTTMEPVPVCE
jgi:hypothetical protein